MKVLKADAFICGLQHGDFSKLMMYIDLPNCFQTFLPCMREEPKNSSLLEVLVVQAFLEENLVIGDQQGRFKSL